MFSWVISGTVLYEKVHVFDWVLEVHKILPPLGCVHLSRNCNGENIDVGDTYE